jgi:hypothetical protein
MVSKLKITVPEPCTQNWDEMQPSEQGRFCLHCVKEVIDFTSFTNDEIKTWFSSSYEKVCGRFEQQQLIDFNGSSTSRKWRTASWKLMLTSCLALFASSKAFSSVSVKSFSQEQTIKKIADEKQVISKDSLFIITGKVTDKEDGLAIPGASIKIVSKPGIGASTGVDGKFKLNVNTKLGDSITLQINYLGYETKFVKLTLKQINNVELDLSIDDQKLTDIVITAGGLIVRRSLPSRILYLFKRTFRNR